MQKAWHSSRGVRPARLWRAVIDTILGSDPPRCRRCVGGPRRSSRRASNAALGLARAPSPRQPRDARGGGKCVAVGPCGHADVGVALDWALAVGGGGGGGARKRWKHDARMTLANGQSCDSTAAAVVDGNWAR